MFKMIRRTRWRHYPVAVLCACLGVWLSIAFHSGLSAETPPMVLFFPSVMFAAWYGGFGPGLLTTAISIFANYLLFLGPHRATAQDILQISLFTLSSVLIVSLITSL